MQKPLQPHGDMHLTSGVRGFGGSEGMYSLKMRNPKGYTMTGTVFPRLEGAFTEPRHTSLSAGGKQFSVRVKNDGHGDESLALRSTPSAIRRYA
jgi:hypothetical protein